MAQSCLPHQKMISLNMSVVLRLRIPALRHFHQLETKFIHWAKEIKPNLKLRLSGQDSMGIKAGWSKVKWHIKFLSFFRLISLNNYRVALCPCCWWVFLCISLFIHNYFREHSQFFTSLWSSLPPSIYFSPFTATKEKFSKSIQLLKQ